MAHQKISVSTLRTYSDWIRGDALKHGKSETYLREIFSGIVKRYGSQITWLNLSKDLSIDHPKTVADYISLLENMDVLFTQYALLEDKLTKAPKKARKVIFNDPFIHHAIIDWLDPSDHACHERIEQRVRDPIVSSQLTEAAAVSHYRRKFPTYYLKGEGEVDMAYVKGKRFYPVEVKWAQQIRPKDIKQIAKYPHALIVGKQTGISTMHGIRYVPLPVHFAQGLGEG